ncbi:LuxR C-terminal-related transcriptional regulator [Jiangella mangrovi]|uniref:DNA-binding CsgD family transcriptional regulator n=1 Tax=Jiangella mangrovi TaxID=1524084 RepID=A0A7W9LNF0_9ACTN|nr:LuxR C-terminal-related transcriptional regulator [Jiangella mangrovi]MBB5790258.1 DNA-binding CsgD family transcriptional regulator [Jiangella mangrovi]
MIEDELRAAIDRGDAPAAARILDRDWPLVVRTNGELLLQAAAIITPEIADEHPIYVLGSEAIRKFTPSDQLRGDRHLDPLLRSVHLIDDPDLRMSALAALLVALRRRNRFDELVDLADRIESLDDAGAHHRDGVYFQLGVGLLFAGELLRAAEFLEITNSMAGPRRIPAAAHLALIFALRGEAPVASHWVERAAGLDDETNTWIYHPLDRSMLAAARALLALDRLDWAEYHQRNAVSRTFLPDNFGGACLLHIRAKAALLLGTQRVAIDEIHRHRSAQLRFRGAPARLMHILLDTAEAELWLSLGDTDHAEQLIRTMGSSPIEIVTKARFNEVLRRETMVRTLSRPDDWPAATSMRDRITLLLIHAGSTIRSGSTDEDRAGVIRRAAIEMLESPDQWLFTLALTDQRVRDELAASDAPGAGAMFGQLAGLPATPFRFARPPSSISEREREVLELLVVNTTIPAIAAALHLSPDTVRNHRKNIYRKLRVNNREEAVEAARNKGLLPPRTGL